MRARSSVIPDGDGAPIETSVEPRAGSLGPVQEPAQGSRRWPGSGSTASGRSCGRPSLPLADPGKWRGIIHGGSAVSSRGELINRSPPLFPGRLIAELINEDAASPAYRRTAWPLRPIGRSSSSKARSVAGVRLRTHTHQVKETLVLKKRGTPFTIVGYLDSTSGGKEFLDGHRNKGRSSLGGLAHSVGGGSGSRGACREATTQVFARDTRPNLHSRFPRQAARLRRGPGEDGRSVRRPGHDASRRAAAPPRTWSRFGEAAVSAAVQGRLHAASGARTPLLERGYRAGRGPCRWSGRHEVFPAAGELIDPRFPGRAAAVTWRGERP